MAILRDINQWDKLNERKKNNVVKMGIMTIMMLLITTMIKYGLDDDDEKELNDRPFAGMVYRAFLQTIRSSMVLPEIIAKAQHPFALFGIAERTANNLFRSFVNKDSEFEFDYGNIKKIAPALKVGEYVGIDEPENN